MKTKLQTLIAGMTLAAGVMIALPAQAQDKPAAEKPRAERPEGGGGGQRGNMLVRLKEALGLSDEQVEKLKPILAAQQEELQALRKSAGETPDREKMREEVKTIRDKYKPKIEAVLTEEQKAKFEKMQDRMRGPGGPGGPGGAEGKKEKPPAE